eukprot:2429811-Pleurochrysis_carterae.AAC.2
MAFGRLPTWQRLPGSRGAYAQHSCRFSCTLLVQGAFAQLPCKEEHLNAYQTAEVSIPLAIRVSD